MKRTGAALFLCACGCYYGAMQGARTLGEDNIALGGSLMMPAFFSSSERLEAEESGEDYLETYPGFCFTIGATERVDLGLAAVGYGVGPFLKYGLLDPGSEYSASVLAGINYVMPPQVINPRGSLAVGTLLGRDLEAYGGWECGYGPDLANIPLDEQSGDDDWDSIGNTFYHAVKIGCIYTIKGEGDSDRYGMLVPAGISFEFTLPLDLDRSMVVAGLGLTY